MQKKTMRTPLYLKEKKSNKKMLLLLLMFFAILTFAIIKNHNIQIMPEKEKLIPKSVLFGNPDKVAVRISYDGLNTSYVAPHNGVMNIFLAPNNDLSKARAITNDTHRGVRDYIWSYDNEHIIYSQDKDGDENQHLFSININTHEIVELTPFKGAKAVLQRVSYKFPNYILASINDRRKDMFDFYLINLRDKKSHLIYRNDTYADLHIDDNMQIRFGDIATPDGGKKIDIFEKQTNSIADLITLIDENAEQKDIDDLIEKINLTETKEFTKIPAEDVYTTMIASFGADYNKFYMIDSRGRDKSGLFEVDIETLEKKLIADDENSDVSDVIIDPITKAVQAVSFTYAKENWKFFDKKIETIYNTIKEKGDYDSEPSIVSRSLNGKSYIVAMKHDTAPPSYYKVTEDKVEFLFSSHEELAGYKLANQHSVVIKSRDDLSLVSYLTLPKDVKTQIVDGDLSVKSIRTDRPVPLVMYVHGGPNARDNWGLDKVHQWLSDRGYAVLSVNYRGSTGFGKNFINAGNGEWSRKMHDDIIDAANWAVSSGITTEGNIGIMGGSYGGYEALVALTFTPEFFNCAIDIVGPSNLVTLLSSIPPYWKPFVESLNRKTGGNITTEEGRKELMDRSPITYVDRISKPLLVGQGANDPRVKRAESDQIVETMQEKGIPVIYALYPDEGHGFVRPENKMSFFTLVEEFLHRNMGGKVEKFTGDFKGSSIQVLAGTEQLSPEIQSALQSKKE